MEIEDIKDQLKRIEYKLDKIIPLCPVHTHRIQELEKTSSVWAARLWVILTGVIISVIISVFTLINRS